MRNQVYLVIACSDAPTIDLTSQLGGVHVEHRGPEFIPEPTGKPRVLSIQDGQSHPSHPTRTSSYTYGSMQRSTICTKICDLRLLRPKQALYLGYRPHYF